MSNSFKLCPTHFSTGGETLCWGAFPPCDPGYEPSKYHCSDSSRAKFSSTRNLIKETPFEIKVSQSYLNLFFLIVWTLPTPQRYIVTSLHIFHQWASAAGKNGHLTPWKLGPRIKHGCRKGGRGRANALPWNLKFCFCC